MARMVMSREHVWPVPSLFHPCTIQQFITVNALQKHQRVWVAEIVKANVNHFLMYLVLANEGNTAATTKRTLTQSKHHFSPISRRLDFLLNALPLASIFEIIVTSKKRDLNRRNDKLKNYSLPIKLFHGPVHVHRTHLSILAETKI